MMQSGRNRHDASDKIVGRIALRSVVLTSALSVLFTLPVANVGDAKAQAASPAFQVATIKHSKPDEPLSVQIRGFRFATTGSTLVDVLKYAYGVHASQIVGGPDWLRTEKFDILADPETESRPASNEMKKMVQQLLADRLHLVFHHARKELPVYAIEIAKNGPLLARSTRDPNGIPVAGYTPGWLSVGNATLVDLASFMQRYVTDRPVVDQTGIVGRYDLNLRWTPDESQMNRPAPQATGGASALPSLYTAIQEQLGLRLKAEKAPVEVFIVDHVEEPSEN